MSSGTASGSEGEYYSYSVSYTKSGSSSESESASDSEEELGARVQRKAAGLALSRKRKREAMQRAILGGSDDGGDSDGYSSSGGGGGRGRKAKSQPKKKKKRSQHAPREISSKTRAGPLSTRLRNLGGAAKNKVRDPRFDDLTSGTTDTNIWLGRYSHVLEYQELEIAELQKELRKARRPDHVEELKAKLKKLRSQHASLVDKRDKAQRNIKRKRMERELVANGKNPYYLKKSERHKLDLALKFEDLKNKGNLAKYMKRKRKKNLARDRKKMPGQS